MSGECHPLYCYFKIFCTRKGDVVSFCYFSWIEHICKGYVYYRFYEAHFLHTVWR